MAVSFIYLQISLHRCAVGHANQEAAQRRVFILDRRYLASALVLRRDRFARTHSGHVVVIRDRFRARRGIALCPLP